MAVRPRSSLLGHIGNTPLLPLHRYGAKHPRAALFAKIERLNPTGSLEDRTALAVVEALEREGKINAGQRLGAVCDPETAISLAFVCTSKSLGLSVVVTGEATPIQLKLLWAYDAEVLPELADVEILLIDLATHPAARAIHQLTTAREIASVKPDAVVAAPGSGLVVEGLREGLGVPVHTPEADDTQAWAAADALARSEGLLVGPVSGAVAHSAYELAVELGEGKTVVAVLPDSRDRYFTS